MPAICAAGYTLVKNLLYFTAVVENQYVLFWIGVLCYIVFQIVLYKPMKTYVFGHELSHAIVGILSGAKIKKFNVGRKSGSVTLTKNNIWITLAPYFLPIYTLAIMTVYILLDWFVNIKQFYSFFLFLMGFSITFHVALNIYIFSTEQLDLKVYGRFFSHAMVLAVNIVVFDLVVSLTFFDSINARDIFVQSYNNIIDIYKFIYDGVVEVCLAFQKTR
jgi:hypothetical protein